MFNGVGLPTARGSGTSGYIQKNLAHVSKPRKSGDKKSSSSKDENANAMQILPKVKTEEVLSRERLREIEVELMELEDELLVDSKDRKSPEEIEEIINKKRKELIMKNNKDANNRKNSSSNHQIKKW